jgi:hypothetical protein
MFHHGLPREAKSCIAPAGDDRFLYRFDQGLRELMKKKETNKRKLAERKKPGCRVSRFPGPLSLDSSTRRNPTITAKNWSAFRVAPGKEVTSEMTLTELL